uniref:RNA-directed RNA polymerase n=2 Tax=unclassified Totiviridae TaxID=39756 RepID=A0A141NWH2_9VIRU|nr:RNA-dependent RNA polymerase [Delisea pulchra totivirus IndA]
MDCVETGVTIYSHDEKNSDKVGDVLLRMNPKSVPAYLDDGGRAVLREDAIMYFVCTLRGQRVNTDVTASLYGSTYKCRIYSDELNDCTYVFAYVDQDVCPIFTSPLVPMNAAFSGIYEYEQCRPASMETLKSATDKAQQKRRPWTIKKLVSGAYTEKVSSGHHEHFRANEMWAAITKVGRARSQNLARLGFQPHHAMMSGLLLWMEILNDELLDFILGTNLLDSNTLEEFVKRGKRISVKAKQLQNLLTMDLRPLFEIDVLTNRILKEVDWDQERMNRETPNLAVFDEEFIYRKARDIFGRVDNKRKRPEKVKWDRFWNNRWQWSAAGSIFCTYDEDKQFVSKDRNLANKFLSLIKMPERSCEYWLSRQPRIDARASVKYEWGKVRAIYGCDLTSYILSTYAFSGCEDSLPSEFPVGNKATAKYVSSVVTGLLDSRLPFTLDFEDFNSQHSTKSMQAVLKAWIDINESYLSEDQVSAGNWTINSLDYAAIHNSMGSKSESYRSKGTLFSGWRLTSFVNTVLNKIYSDAIMEGSDMHPSLHNGDDVLVGTRNLKVAFFSLRNAKKYNLRLQPTKTAFGSIAEFLRIDHTAPDGGQYANRSIATLVHSRVESGPPAEAISAIESYESRYKDFWYRTGRLDLIVSMRNIAEIRMAKIFRVSKEFLEELRIHHRVVGGLGETVDHKIDYKFKITSEEMIEYDVDEVSSVMKAPGISHYAVELARLFVRSDLVGKFKDELVDATLRSCAIKRKKLLVVENKEMQRYHVLRALYKAHSYLSSSSLFGKAKLVGFSINALQRLRRNAAIRNHVYSSDNPVEFLRVVS